MITENELLNMEIAANIHDQKATSKDDKYSVCQRLGLTPWMFSNEDSIKDIIEYATKNPTKYRIK